MEWYTTSSSRPWNRSRNGTGPSGPTTSTVPSNSTIGSRRRAAAIASPSRVWAFSRTRSSSRAACQVARSTTGGRPGTAVVGSSGVVVMVSSTESRAMKPGWLSEVDAAGAAVGGAGVAAGRLGRDVLGAQLGQAGRVRHHVGGGGDPQRLQGDRPVQQVAGEPGVAERRVAGGA